MTDPSPSPWRIVKRSSINGAAIVAADGVRVGTISPKADKSLWQKEADAEVIGKAPENALIAEAARDLVALWISQKIEGLPRSERNAAIEAVRWRLIGLVKGREATGFLAALTPEQRDRALSYCGEDC